MRDLTATVAGAAALWLGAGLGARSLTCLTCGVAVDLDLALGSTGGVQKRHRKLDLDVVAAWDPTPAAATGEAAATAEDVRERREDVLDAAKASREAALRGSLMTKAIVETALLGIGEHRVRLGSLLELFFGFLVPRSAIGMKLHRHPTVGLL